MLKDALKNLPNVPYCLIDCPPSLGILTLNALIAANELLIPTQPEGMALRALPVLFETIDIARRANPALSVLGVIPTFVDGRTAHHKEIIQAMYRKNWPVISNVIINRSIRAAEAPSLGQSILTYAPNNPVALAYRQLAAFINNQEVL